MENEMIMVPKFTLGPIEMVDIQIFLSDANSQASNLIGMDLLQDHMLVFDFVNHSVLVDIDVNEELHYFDLPDGDKVKTYVDAYIGETKVNAIWDTGAGITVVNNTLIDTYPHCFEQLQSIKGTDTTGATTETPMYLMQSMSIGNYQFPPHKVISIDLSAINAKIETPIEIILGYNSLNKANWVFDFPNKKWSILQMNS